jgi:CDP-paratose 2-epimerase
VIPLLSELKVKWLRTDFPYSLWQSHREIFEEVDEIVEEAHRRGIQILPVLGTWTTGSSRPPRNREDFLQYIEEVVNRYNGKIGNYEFWNEPDCIWFWKSSIGKFSRLMDAAAKTAKSVNSQIKIGMNVAWHYSPTQPWALRFTQKVAQRGGLHRIDFLGLHGYPGTWEPGDAISWGKRIQDTKKLLRELA